uniref:Uncharacterized protein n=1 Tax=Panagrolaimus davidi TaxID=227884 RepID=A0A914Q1U6_9BILA
MQEKLKLDVINTFWMTSMELATDNQKLRNTSKFPMNNFKPKYDFKISEIKYFCDCCAECGKTAATKAEPLQKQNMVMDFMLIFADENESDPFEKPKLEPGKWKTRANSARANSARANSARANSARAISARAISARAISARAVSARAISARAVSARAISARAVSTTTISTTTIYYCT